MTGSGVRVYADGAAIGQISESMAGYQPWSLDGEPLGEPQVTFSRALALLGASPDVSLRWERLVACPACGGSGWALPLPK